MDWFRSWHGAPTDLKWLSVCEAANQKDNRYVTCVTHVTAVTWALLDHASQSFNRGSSEGFDFEGYSLYAGMNPAHVLTIIAALHDKKVLKDNHFVSWSKRQSSDAAARMKRMRERRKNEDVTAVTERASHVPRVDKIRVDKNIPPIPPKRGDAGFELLWESWKPFEMVKGNKSQANKSYEKALASGVLSDVLMTAAKKYCSQCLAQRCKTQHVATWLNQRGWETPDEPVTSGGYDLYKMPSPAGG